MESVAVKLIRSCFSRLLLLFFAHGDNMNQQEPDLTNSLIFFPQGSISSHSKLSDQPTSTPRTYSHASCCRLPRICIDLHASEAQTLKKRMSQSILFFIRGLIVGGGGG